MTYDSAFNSSLLPRLLAVGLKKPQNASLWWKAFTSIGPSLFGLWLRLFASFLLVMVMHGTLSFDVIFLRVNLRVLVVWAGIQQLLSRVS